MGATHFLTKTLPRVSTEMSLHVLAYNFKRLMRILGEGWLRFLGQIFDRDKWICPERLVLIVSLFSAFVNQLPPQRSLPSPKGAGEAPV
jgi:hypothetical protein